MPIANSVHMIVSSRFVAVSDSSTAETGLSYATTGHLGLSTHAHGGEEDAREYERRTTGCGSPKHVHLAP